ncbi:MAG TPA: hypothetical protein VL854_07415 [Nitrososphaeraceae archaeon]|nr:hypothetical protein [Nitrososphaeraceae archaeon]
MKTKLSTFLGPALLSLGFRGPPVTILLVTLSVSCYNIMRHMLRKS